MRLKFSILSMSVIYNVKYSHNILMLIKADKGTITI